MKLNVKNIKYPEVFEKECERIEKDIFKMILSLKDAKEKKQNALYDNTFTYLSGYVLGLSKLLDFQKTKKTKEGIVETEPDELYNWFKETLHRSL